MEHILQFAISIDEDRIQEEIKRSAVNKKRKVLFVCSSSEKKF